MCLIQRYVFDKKGLNNMYYTQQNRCIKHNIGKAVEGIKKTMLPDEVKADLKAFYQRYTRCVDYG